MKIINVFLVILFSIFYCSCSKRVIEFIFYESTYNHYYQGDKHDTIIQIRYLIDNFAHTKAIEHKIDSFACNYFKNTDIRHKTYLSFYKVSKFTNLEYLKKHPSHFEEGNWIEEIESSDKSDYLWLYSAKKIKDTINVTKSHGGASRMNQEYSNLFYPNFKCSIKK